MPSITYNATRTAEDFHLDLSEVKLLFGAVGSGKSAACCVEILKRIFEQKPGYDGIRYSRWAICRNTYSQLRETTIKTWKHWVPEEHFGKIKSSPPFNQRIRIRDIDAEILFLSLDSDADERKLMSLELTGIYFNELRFISEFLFDAALKRIPRYPSASMCDEITYPGVIADTNPPNTSHWIYKRFELSKYPNHKVFKYVPAVLKVEKEKSLNFENAISQDGTIYINNPDADYINNLPDKSYYIKIVRNSYDKDIRIYCEGDYGSINSNKLVYVDYNQVLHVSDTIKYEPSLELGLGWDFGRTPACVITQMTNDGVLKVLDEICGEDVQLDEFIKSVVIPKLNKSYYGWKKNYYSIGDPSGSAKNALSNNCCFDVLRECGIITASCVTNSIERRIRAVSFFLRKLVKGKPTFLIDSVNCPQLKKGFDGDYYFKEIKTFNETGDKIYSEEPEKTMTSHPHDALQYICVYYHRFYDRSEDARGSNNNNFSYVIA